MGILDNLFGISSDPDYERPRRREPDYEASRRREPDYQPSRRREPDSYESRRREPADYAPRRQERTAPNQDLPSETAIIYRSELDQLSRFILDYPNIETGGQLFGYWTGTGTPVVCYVIGPGYNAQHYDTKFVQDWDYLQRVGRELHDRYRLQHIGEWHSHHQLGLAHPSGGDVNTMSYGVGKPGFPRLLLCIGNCTRTTSTVNAFNFHENTPRRYVQAAWDVVEMESPFRSIVDTELQRLILPPMTHQASHGQIRSTRNIVQESATVGTHWLTESAENVETMKAFVGMVQSVFPSHTIKTEVLKTGEPQIAIKGADACIKLPYGFPAKGPILTDEKGRELTGDSRDEWEIGEEPLTTTFGRWLSARLGLYR